MASESRTNESIEVRKRFREGAGAAAATLWPVLLLTACGALMGQEIDWHRDTNPRFTIALLALGVVLGSWAGKSSEGFFGRDEAESSEESP